MYSKILINYHIGIVCTSDWNRLNSDLSRGIGSNLHQLWFHDFKANNVRVNSLYNIISAKTNDMSGINKAILVGHLGKDPDLKLLENDVHVVNFPLVTSEIINKNGVKVEQSEWPNIIMWRSLRRWLTNC